MVKIAFLEVCIAAIIPAFSILRLQFYGSTKVFNSALQILHMVVGKAAIKSGPCMLRVHLDGFVVIFYRRLVFFFLVTSEASVKRSIGAFMMLLVPDIAMQVVVNGLYRYTVVLPQVC